MTFWDCFTQALSAHRLLYRLLLLHFILVFEVMKCSNMHYNWLWTKKVQNIAFNLLRSCLLLCTRCINAAIKSRIMS